NEDSITATENGGIGYTHKLTEYIIEHSKDAPAVISQKDDPMTDVFTGLPFKNTDGELDTARRAADFHEYIDSLDNAGKANAYVTIKSIPDDTLVQQTVEQTLASMSREDMEARLIEAMAAQTGMSEDDIQSYAASISDEDMNELFEEMIAEQFKSQYAAEVHEQLAEMTTEQLAGALMMEVSGYTDEQCAALYDSVLEFSESSYEENLLALGCIDLDNPSAINLYASSFAAKELIEESIADYNKTVDELQEIQYTDYVGLMMSSISTIINAITYILIAFVAVSLIVSSIMIGVITLISVQERTKEIGILRAIGASKRNVSNMFNAETVIIGFTSGMLGVLITYLLCILINVILHHLTGIGNLSAFLPLRAAIILIAISVLLTLIAGIIPSRSAAKKDPVVALRTE
ncbi:MAG: ABC transporter permease, partial [Clostridia bacterium]|nr:ABC transporter permease [Clostridia bacterium]